jgi:IclR family transcriptional regulator, KDG regulon repressor
MATRPGTSAPNQTLTNGLRVLECVARTHRDFSVSELAADLKLPRSHIHRLLRTLVDAGYLTQSADTRKYRSDFHVLALAGPFAENLPLRVHGGPVLRTLSGNVRAASYIAVSHQGRPLIVMSDFYRGAKGAHYLGLGERLPRHASAFGKLFLALQRLPVEASELKRLTSATITTLRALREELDTIRRQGYSVNRCENSEGLYSFAAPVYGPTGELLGGVGFALAADLVVECGEAHYTKLVTEAAAALAERMAAE